MSKNAEVMTLSQKAPSSKHLNCLSEKLPPKRTALLEIVGSTAEDI